MKVGELMVHLGKFPVASEVIMEVDGYECQIRSVDHMVTSKLEAKVIISDYIEGVKGDES